MAISIQITQTPDVGLADNPIVIGAKATGFPTDATFLQVVITVNEQYRFPQETDDGRIVLADVSSAFRALFHDTYTREIFSGNSETISSIQAAIKVHAEYIQDGELQVTNSVSVSSFNVLPGGLSETYRLFNNLSDASGFFPSQGTKLLSTKPTTPEMVNVGDKLFVSHGSASGYTTSTTNVSAEGSISGTTAYAEDNPDRIEFAFLNSFCVFESVSAQTKESLSYPIETEEKTIVHSPSFLPKPSLMAVHTAPNAEWNMSSGHITREWANWWTTEFLTAKRHWIRMGNNFIPVLVKPDKESTLVYDKAKQELISVNFTVKIGVSGPI